MTGERAPVIIIGMHRSGTTMVTRLLARLGLFVGAKLDSNAEPPFFRAINDWLLGQCGGRWDQPIPIRHLLESPDMRELVAEYLQTYLASPRAISFFGWRGWSRSARARRMSQPWGWKDPRNTFTLPLWLDLFPQARVIHIYRHGIDVASSLVRRWEKSLAKRRERFGRRRGVYAIRPQTGGFVESHRCGTLEGALSLWREYVEEARRQVQALGERAIEVQYETFLASPAVTLEPLAQFCGLEANHEQIARTSAEVRPERAYAYREDAGLQRFARQVSGELGMYGYSA